MGISTRPLLLAEKKGGSSGIDSSMEEFADFIQVASLVDLPLGGDYTWTKNRQGEANIQRRLDRFLISKDWDITFPFPHQKSEFPIPTSIMLNCSSFRSFKIR